MRIVFFGTSEFAVSTLQKLSLSEHRILAVVTAEDKRKGRGLKYSFSPVKVFAQEAGLSLLQPKDLRANGFLQALKKAQADLFVVVAYGKILPEEILAIPKKFAINLHASLLPKYRGAAPINWAIIRGESQTGVTVFKMDKFMDRGEIILQRKTDITPADTALSLGAKLTRLGAEAIVEAIDLIARNEVVFIAQDEDKATYAPKLKKEDGLIDWSLKACEIHNRIRGLVPWPGAFTYRGDKLLKIWESRVVESEVDTKPGEVVKVGEEGILVQTGKNRLLLMLLQLEGKRRMSAKEFILGHRVKVGEELGLKY